MSYISRPQQESHCSDEAESSTKGKMVGGIPLSDLKIHHRYYRGLVLGKVDFFLEQPRTDMMVVAAKHKTTIYRLSRASLERMQKEEPQMALSLHQLLVKVSLLSAC